MPGVPAVAFQPYLEVEAARAWELFQAGVFRELYFHQDRSSAILVLGCVDVQLANRALDTLPFVKVGLVAFEVILLKPFPGFSRLFTEAKGVAGS
jgi:hypothetical protein